MSKEKPNEPRKEDGGPAYPIGSGDMRDPMGMTLRDHFAALAMQGMLYRGVGGAQADAISRMAYIYADAMLKARDQ